MPLPDKIVPGPPGPAGPPGISGPPGVALPIEVIGMMIEEWRKRRAEEQRKWEKIERGWRIVSYLWLTAGLFGTIALISALAGCAPVVWDRPNTTPDQFAMDRARCTLIANTASHRQDSTSIFASSASNLGSSIGDGIVNGIEIGENFQLCMQAEGYRRR